MYHELELAGRKLCQSAPGYVRYILRLETFREQMAWIKNAGWRGLNVSEALRYPAEPQPDKQAVCITFDDGCETDLIAAAPELRKLGLHATFYVTAGFLGMPGYLSAEQLRELDSEGLEIGCHSMTHAYLSDISEPELKREIVDAKNRIEQIVGRAIDHFSCPGGRYDRRALAMARQAGFRTVANSDFHANSSSTNAYEFGRIAMMRDITIREFSTICRGVGLWKKRLQYRTRRAVQRIFGNHVYDQLRSALLGKHHS